MILCQGTIFIINIGMIQQETLYILPHGKRNELPGAPSIPNDPYTLTDGLISGSMAFTDDTNEFFIGSYENSKVWNRTSFPYRNIQVLTENAKNIEELLTYEYRYRVADQELASTKDLLGNPVKRKLQERLDEIVSVKSYGAIGDGINDDTWPLLRAILDVSTTARSNPTIGADRKRSLYFPAGTYKVSMPICLPDSASWFGDGPDQSIILLDTTEQYPVIQTISPNVGVNDLISEEQYLEKLSLGITSYDDGTLFPIIKNTIISNLGFKNTFGSNVIKLNRISNAKFFNVNFDGAWDCNVDINLLNKTSERNSAISISSLSEILKCDFIHFYSCKVSHAKEIMYLSDLVENIKFIDCIFQNSIKGFTFNDYIKSEANIPLTGNKPLIIMHNSIEPVEPKANEIILLSNQSIPATNGYYRVRYDTPTTYILEIITHSNLQKYITLASNTFKNIAYYGLKVFSGINNSGSYVKSLSNFYLDVGQNINEFCEAEITPIVSPIIFDIGTCNNASLIDDFSRTDNLIPLVDYHYVCDNMIMNSGVPIHLGTPTYSQIIFSPNILLPEPTGIILPLSSSDTWKISMSYVYDGLTSIKQVGYLDIITDGISVHVSENFSGIGISGLNFTGIISGNNLEIYYTNTLLEAGKIYYLIEQKPKTII